MIDFGGIRNVILKDFFFFYSEDMDSVGGALMRFFEECQYSVGESPSG